MTLDATGEEGLQVSVMVYLTDAEFPKFLAGNECEGVLRSAFPGQLVCVLVAKDKVTVHERKFGLGLRKLVIAVAAESEPN